MKKKLYLLLLMLAVATGSFAQKKEEKAVRKAFDKYRSALLDENGDEALKYICNKTILYYNDLLKTVKHSDSLEVSKLGVFNKLMVFSVRHRVPKEVLLTVDGKGLLLYSINEGMVGKNTVNNASIGGVTINGDTAKGDFLIYKDITPFTFAFYKEDGSWKLDITSIFLMTGEGISKAAERSELPEDEFILDILGRGLETKPGKEVWLPVVE